MKFIFFVFLMTIFLAFSQFDTIYFDENWEVTSKKNASYFRIIEKAGNLWKVEDYYINGSLQMSGYFSDMEKEIRENTFIFHDENGQISELINYKNGLKHGKYESYFENGNCDIQQTWENGVKNGAVIGYYENGDKLFLGQYRNDNKYGVWQFFDKLGNVGLERVYERNVNIAGVNLNLTMPTHEWYSLDSKEQADKLYLFFARDELLDSNNNFVNPLLTIVLEKDTSDKKLLDFALRKIQDINIKIVKNISNQIELDNSLAFQIEYLNQDLMKIQGYLLFYKNDDFIATIYLETSDTTFEIVKDEFLQTIHSIKSIE